MSNYSSFDTEWFDLTGFQRDVLIAIASADDKPSGQDIKRDLEERYTSITNHGRLYPNLDALVDHDLVEKGERTRRTNFYEVTDQGQLLINRHDEDLDDAVTAVDTGSRPIADGGDH